MGEWWFDYSGIIAAQVIPLSLFNEHSVTRSEKETLFLEHVRT